MYVCFFYILAQKIGRMSNKSNDTAIYIAIAVFCCLLLSFPIYRTCSANRHANFSEETETSQTDEVHQLFKTSAISYPKISANLKSLILERSNYVLSFNTDWNVPNWVAWELNTEKLAENVSRRGFNFIPDPDLPPEDAVQWNEYRGSGLSRGHMCPAADSRWSAEAMSESFYMTNVCPQNTELNNGDWQELERSCRRWVQREGQLFIVCGPIFYKDNNNYIGTIHRIRVPDAFFKVVLCLTSDVPKGIGFIFKNKEGNQRMGAFVNTIDEVERITGFDFFSELDDRIEEQVEAECDLNLW